MNIVRGLWKRSVAAVLLECCNFFPEHSCLDIAHALNYYAIYMFNPRLSHEKALKRSRCYLKATRDRGFVLEPTKKWKVDAYPAAGFAGLYDYKKPTYPTCTKSRVGFLINISDCPVVWMSKLQT